MSSFYERFMTGARRRSRACCAPVSRGFGGAVAREFIAQHVVTVRLVKNEQKWARQYSLFVPTDTDENAALRGNRKGRQPHRTSPPSHPRTRMLLTIVIRAQKMKA